MSDNNVKDASDNLIENQDLLDILAESSSSTSELEKAMSGQSSDEKEIEDKMTELKALATQLDNSSSKNNPGTGDIDVDLSNWFNGTDKLPSDELNEYIGNSSVKMDYGLTKHTLTNFDMMGSLHKFMTSSFELLFDDSAVMGLTPEELEDRTKMAFAMYKELASISQRTVMSIKDYKLKSNSSSDDIDKISLLLSSIPSEKLKALLNEISAN